MIGQQQVRFTSPMIKSQKYRVILDYQPPYPDPIVFRKGEQVTVGREYKDDPDWQNWRWCRGKSNNNAWVPTQYLTIDGKSGIFKRDYNARELTIQKGEKLEIYQVINGFGMAEKSDGNQGWVPLRNLEII
jgi:hypothetical protein